MRGSLAFAAIAALPLTALANPDVCSVAVTTVTVTVEPTPPAESASVAETPVKSIPVITLTIAPTPVESLTPVKSATPVESSPAESSASENSPVETSSVPYSPSPSTPAAAVSTSLSPAASSLPPVGAASSCVRSTTTTTLKVKTTVTVTANPSGSGVCTKKTKASSVAAIETSPAPVAAPLTSSKAKACTRITNTAILSSLSASASASSTPAVYVAPSPTPSPSPSSSSSSVTLGISDFVFATPEAAPGFSSSSSSSPSSSAVGAAAVTTSAAAAPAASSAAPVSNGAALGSSKTGEATFYGGNTDGGMCSFSGYTLPAGLFGTALSDSNWATGGNCGACVKVTGPDGNSITAMITDQCPGCGTNHLDLYENAFTQLASASTGVINVDWELVECGITSPLVLRNKEGTSKFWFSIQVLNANVPVSKLEVSTDGGNSWSEAGRTEYNYFENSSGYGTDSVSVRVTSTTGKTVVVDNVGTTAGEKYTASSNF